MADAAWPGRTRTDDGLCVVLRAGYAETIESNVRRTQFEDGGVAQKVAKSRDVMVRSFTFMVKDGDLAAFRAWLRANAADWFDFTDLDQTEREVRVRGGVGGVRLEAETGSTFEGERFHRGTAELEGYL